MNILTFSGSIPEQICDTKRSVRWNGAPVVSHYCGYAAWMGPGEPPVRIQ